MKTHPLRAWRESQTPRITLDQLALEAGCTSEYLSMIETAGRTPSLPLAVKLSAITDDAVSVQDFLAEAAA